MAFPIGDPLQSLKLAFCGFCGLRGILWRYCDSPLGVEERHWNGILDRNDTLCRSPAMPNGRCRMHGGLSPGAPKGNRNALKHGRYTAESLARRRELAALLRTMRALAGASAEED